jgi:hypothetical protein
MEDANYISKRLDQLCDKLEDLEQSVDILRRESRTQRIEIRLSGLASDLGALSILWGLMYVCYRGLDWLFAVQ